MKQIAMGWTMYAQDYDGRLVYFRYFVSGPGLATNPVGTSEMAAVEPYIKNTGVYMCPNATTIKPTGVNCLTNPTHWYCSSYGLPAVHASDNRIAAVINIRFGGSVTILDTVPEPSLTCLLAENRRTPADVNGMSHFYAFSFPAGGLDGLPVLDRHLDGSNYAYMDGHVKWLKEETAQIPRTDNQAIKFWWPKP
jgi:prepilin-type processing-associated H-X9-DG protein